MPEKSQPSVPGGRGNLMPIATGRRGGIGRPGLVHWTAARRSTSGAAPRRGMCGKAKAGDGDSCSSSSIGQDSDNVAGGSASEGEESRETEMESGSKGPLDTLQVLEESLPMRYSLLISMDSASFFFLFLLSEFSNRACAGNRSSFF